MRKNDNERIVELLEEILAELRAQTTVMPKPPVKTGAQDADH